MSKAAILSNIAKKIISIFIVTALMTQTVFAVTFTVDNDGDAADAVAGDGNCATAGAACTLRAAIEEANELAGTDIINFSDGVTRTLTPGNVYETIDTAVTIDGNSAGAGVIAIDGGNQVFSPFTIGAGGDNSVIKGLYIFDFNGVGITIASGVDTVTIGGSVAGEGNVIGLLTDDTTADATTIAITSAGTNVTIQGNTLSGNTSHGISLTDGTANVTIIGNKIGTNPDGDTAKANTGNGINVNFTGTQNVGTLQIGGGTAAERNVISGNGGNGILFTGDGSAEIQGTVNIQGNYIGTNAAGTADLGNTSAGINHVEANLASTVGWVIGSATDTAAEGNVISGNDGSGVAIEDGTSLTFSENYVGMDAAGTGAVGNTGDGVSLDSITVTVDDNTIGNNTTSGLTISGDDAITVTITDNNVGVDATGANDEGNSGYGIYVNSSSATTVTIGESGSDRNVIGNTNNGTGITVADTAATATVTIKNNYIGVETAGATSASNAAAAVLISDGKTINIVDNVLANSNYGLQLQSAVATIATITGNKIGTTSAGTVAAGNTNDGAYITGAALATLTIGGATSLLGNVFAASGAVGLRLVAMASGGTATIQGSYFGIGSDGTTTTSLANDKGLQIQDGNVVLGGDNALGADGTGDLEEGNVISNNTSNSVAFENGADTFVGYGNIVGLKKSAGVYAAAAGNGSGFNVSSNTITSFILGAADGTTVTSKRNIISGNTGSGVDFSTSDTALATITIINNYIGTDYLGTAAVANTEHGVYVNGSANPATVNIGGTGTDEGNLLSGNTKSGLDAKAANATFNVLGNYIGTNAAGDAAIPNVEYGLDLDNGTCLIGDGTSDGRNIISGNTLSGISIDSATATIKGNYIGTDSTGESALGNGAGALVAGLINYGGIIAQGNSTTIGGTNAGGVLTNGNLISGNYGQGILAYVGASLTIAGNYIGTDKDGDTELPNVNATAGSPDYDLDGSADTDLGEALNGSGIILWDIMGAALTGTIIGGTSSTAGNVIAGNDGIGISIVHYAGVALGAGGGQDWASGYIKNNIIGLASDGTTSLPNDTYGMYINSNTGTIENLTIGSSTEKNTSNNTSHTGWRFEDIEDADFVAQTFSELEDENSWSDTSTGPTYKYIAQYVSDVLTDWVPKYTCEDGTDNDGDGLTDYPNDPGCSSATDTDETDAAVVVVEASTEGAPSIYVTTTTRTTTTPTAEVADDVADDVSEQSEVDVTSEDSRDVADTTQPEVLLSEEEIQKITDDQRAVIEDAVNTVSDAISEPDPDLSANEIDEVLRSIEEIKITEITGMTENEPVEEIEVDRSSE